jgi:hypothetical protein
MIGTNTRGSGCVSKPDKHVINKNGPMTNARIYSRLRRRLDDFARGLGSGFDVLVLPTRKSIGTRRCGTTEDGLS